MKKTALFVLSMVTMNVHAQDIMKTLLESAPTKKSVTNTTPGTKTTEQVSSTQTKTTVTGKSCQELNVDEQKSLPLKVINSLIQDEPRKISISHDYRTGILKVTSPQMIGNCNSMIEWKVNQAMVEGENTYLVEARIKQGAECKDGKCSYKTYKVQNGFDISPVTAAYTPNMKGFTECLKDSGAFKDKGAAIDEKGIYYDSIDQRISDIKDSGRILFVSEGPASSQIGPVSGDKFKIIADCKYYEELGPGEMVRSEADENKRQLLAEAAQLEKECTIDDYHKVADFRSKTDLLASQMAELHTRLLKGAAQKSAKAILEGTATEDDMRVIADFEKHIIEPQKEKVLELYAQLEGLKGTERQAKQAELKAALQELANYANKPYYSDAQINKLLSEGKFEQAEQIYGMRLTVAEHVKIGTPTKDGKGVHTPELIAKNIDVQMDAYSDNLEKVKEKYEITTGQVTGTAKAYLELANRHRRFVTVRTQNFMEAMQDEYKRTIPGGYCYAFFRNTPKCVAKSQERIQELQFLLAKNNEVDKKKAAEYDQKATEYAELEKQGRQYVAAQTGAEAPAENKEDDSLKPPTTDDSIYTFDASSGQATAQQCTPGIQGTGPNPFCAPQQGYLPQQPAAYPQVMPYQQNMFNQGNPYLSGQPFMAQAGGYAQFGAQGGYGMQQPYMGMQQPMFGQPYGQPQMPWGQPAMNGYQFNPYQMPRY